MHPLNEPASKYLQLQKHILELLTKISQRNNLFSENRNISPFSLNRLEMDLSNSFISLPVAGCTMLAAAPNARFFCSVFGKDPPTGI